MPANLERADALLAEAHRAGASLAVLPGDVQHRLWPAARLRTAAEDPDGPTSATSWPGAAQWGMAIAAGFVERDGHHLYDSVGFALPDGRFSTYRKRNLVFWERFRFRPGRDPLVVATPWGRVGFAVCADMIYRKVWDDYRGRIDLAVVAAAWPDFADRDTGRKHWLFGHVGPLSGAIPGQVAVDLGIPVVFANQCGETQTVIPILKARIADRFAGLSSIADGRHGPAVVAGTAEQVLLSEITIHPNPGPRSWRSTSSSAPAASSSASARSLIGAMGSVVYWRACRRRGNLALGPAPSSLARSSPNAGLSGISAERSPDRPGPRPRSTEERFSSCAESPGRWIGTGARVLRPPAPGDDPCHRPPGARRRAVPRRARRDPRRPAALDRRPRRRPPADRQRGRLDLGRLQRRTLRVPRDPPRPR